MLYCLITTKFLMTTTLISSNDTLFALQESDIEQFYREGWCFAPRFLATDSVDQLNEAYANQVAERTDEKEWISLPFRTEAQAELQTPRVLAMMERLLGGPIQLWLGMYAVVMPGGQGLAWHQDNQYTHILGHMANVFVALDPITTENAGLWIAPRSHRLGRQPNLNENTGHRRAADPENPQPVASMAPGDAVIFHRELLHHSKQNRSNSPRRAFAFQVSSASCRFAETGKLVEAKKVVKD